jgi:predicted metal-dependent enzyme (double-stranded beta helix superfamily)
MFDVDALISECQSAVGEATAPTAVRAVLSGVLSNRSSVTATLGRDHAGIEILYNAPDLTVLNVVWAPHMAIFPHDHRMWAVIGIYSGAEDNQLYRRAAGGLVESGGRTLEEADVFALGTDAIHSVRNPLARFTGAIHVYGGDFVARPRSQWDPVCLTEAPYDAAAVRAVFEEANAAWVARMVN